MRAGKTAFAPVKDPEKADLFRVAFEEGFIGTEPQKACIGLPVDHKFRNPVGRPGVAREDHFSEKGTGLLDAEFGDLTENNLPARESERVIGSDDSRPQVSKRLELKAVRTNHDCSAFGAVWIRPRMRHDGGNWLNVVVSKTPDMTRSAEHQIRFLGDGFPLKLFERAELEIDAARFEKRSERLPHRPHDPDIVLRIRKHHDGDPYGSHFLLRSSLCSKSKYCGKKDDCRSKGYRHGEKEENGACFWGDLWML